MTNLYGKQQISEKRDFTKILWTEIEDKDLNDLTFVLNVEQFFAFILRYCQVSGTQTHCLDDWKWLKNIYNVSIFVSGVCKSSILSNSLFQEKDVDFVLETVPSPSWSKSTSMFLRWTLSKKY